MALLLAASTARAQIYTDDNSAAVQAPPPGAGRYHLRNTYPMYPSYPAGTSNSPDTVEVGRPYYSSPYYYGGPGYSAPYGGVSSDGSSVYVPGR